jgi:hypothetical protein
MIMTLIVNCREVAIPKVPIVHVTVPPDSLTDVPAGAVPVDRYATPAGRGSVTATESAALGPVLSTVNV